MYFTLIEMIVYTYGNKCPFLLWATSNFTLVTNRDSEREWRENQICSMRQDIIRLFLYSVCVERRQNTFIVCLCVYFCFSHHRGFSALQITCILDPQVSISRHQTVLKAFIIILLFVKCYTKARLCVCEYWKMNAWYILGCSPSPSSKIGDLATPYRGINYNSQWGSPTVAASSYITQYCICVYVCYARRKRFRDQVAINFNDFLRAEVKS